jgi:hypothetical protein
MKRIHFSPPEKWALLVASSSIPSVLALRNLNNNIN